MVHMKYCSFFLSIIQEGGECEANLHIYRMDSDNDGIYYKYYHSMVLLTTTINWRKVVLM